mgnify:CR=1 FL=1
MQKPNHRHPHPYPTYNSIEVMGKVSIHNTVETNVSDGTTFDYSTIVVDES